MPRNMLISATVGVSGAFDRFRRAGWHTACVAVRLSGPTGYQQNYASEMI